MLREAPQDVLEEVAAETGVDFLALKEWPEAGLHPVSRGRIGLFQRYYGGNMDEGWTRLCLENFSFPLAVGNSIVVRNAKEKTRMVINPKELNQHSHGELRTVLHSSMTFRNRRIP